MGMLKQEMTRLAKQAGGSHKTVHDRIKLAQRFCQRLVVAQNVQIRYVRHLKARDIEGISVNGWRRGLQSARCTMKQPCCESFRGRPDAISWPTANG